MDQQTIKNLKLRMEYENNRTAPPEGFPQFPDIPAERYVSVHRAPPLRIALH